MDSFIYPAFKRLKHNLGKSDAVSEFTQLAVESLLSDLKKADRPTERLEQLTTEFGIKVNSFTEHFVRNRKSHLDILAVYEIAEDFFKSLRRESKIAWAARKDGEDYLTWYWRNLPADCRADKGANTLRELFDYYRLVRNEFMHSKQDTAGLANSAAYLKALKDNVPQFSKLDAPQPYENIGFDDVVLFTRLTKDLAKYICKCLKPSQDTLFDVLNACYEEDTGKNLRVLKRIKDEARRRNSLTSMLKRYFSMDDQDAAYAVESLLKGLLA